MTPSLLHLPNGLCIVALRKDGPPLVTIGVAYHVGAANEEPTKTGYAHLFEHLMFDNFSHPDGKSFDELVTEAGGTSNAYTTYDWTYYHITLPSNAWRFGLELEAIRMHKFAISQRALDTQRAVVIEEIAENVFNQPYGRLSQLAAQAAFEQGCCYSWDVYGSIEHLQAMTLEDARQWYERYYRPNNAVLVVVGALDSVTDVLECAADYFGPLTPSEHHALPPPLCPVRRHHVERDSTLPSDMLVCMYHLPGIKDKEAVLTASLLSVMLSAGRSSPVARHFVREQLLSHQASTTVDIREHGSLFEFSALARNQSITAEFLLDQWQKLLGASVAIPHDPEHLERAHNKIRRRYAQAFQTTESLADIVASAMLLLNDPEHPWKELQMVHSIPSDALVELARTLATEQPAIVQYSTTT
ncbi:MAG: peptidase M16 [Candidatus Kapaibacterium sp.]|nr:MAG: peptidase M16 [Candidatus Kapabacteria bacterium]